MKYQMKPLFKERMQALLPDAKDFQAFDKIIHTEPEDYIRCNTLKITPKELLEKLNKKWKVTQPSPKHPEIMLVEGKKESYGCAQRAERADTIRRRDKALASNCAAAKNLLEGSNSQELANEVSVYNKIRRSESKSSIENASRAGERAERAHTIRPASGESNSSTKESSKKSHQCSRQSHSTQNQKTSSLTSAHHLEAKHLKSHHT